MYKCNSHLNSDTMQYQQRPSAHYTCSYVQECYKALINIFVELIWFQMDRGKDHLDGNHKL